MNNIDFREIGYYEELGASWWEKKGPMRALHDINPVRVSFIASRTRIHNRNIIDIGCGAGLLCEELARAGACVTGIDLSKTSLQAADIHAKYCGLDITYAQMSAEDMLERSPDSFDVLTCLELLEHVPDPRALVRTCSRLVKPGGDVFFATINRTWLADILVARVAETLKILRPGTHNSKKFIKPSELKIWALEAGLVEAELKGLLYIPYIRICRITSMTGLNYIFHFRRAGLENKL